MDIELDPDPFNRPRPHIDPNNGAGWYEFIHTTKATTHIAYVFESGGLYLPEVGVCPDDFNQAAYLGHVYRLVRAEDQITHPINLDGISEVPD